MRLPKILVLIVVRRRYSGAAGAGPDLYCIYEFEKRAVASSTRVYLVWYGQLGASPACP